MTKLSFTRTIKEIPCDHPTPCGWKHVEYDGPTQWFIDGRKASEGAALSYRTGGNA